jgi:hypothetical protein
MITDISLMIIVLAMMIVLWKIYKLQICPSCKWPCCSVLSEKEISRNGFNYNVKCIRKCNKCGHIIKRVEARNDS